MPQRKWRKCVFYTSPKQTVILPKFYFRSFVNSGGQLVAYFEWDNFVLIAFYPFNGKEKPFEDITTLYKAGLGNVRPEGHMRPTKHLYVTQTFFQCW